MRPKDNIEQKVNRFDVDINDQKAKVFIESLLKVHSKNNKLKSDNNRFDNWRFIMKNGKIKFAAVILMMLSVMTYNYFRTGSIDGATIAWADTKIAMQQQQWLHMTSDIENINGEQWMNYKNQLYYVKLLTGKTWMTDIVNQTKIEYDAKTNTLTKQIFELGGEINMSSPIKMLLSMHDYFSQAGESTYLNEVIDGHDVQVEQFDLSGDFGIAKRKIIKMYIASDSKLLIKISLEDFDDKGLLIKSGKAILKYPNHGPKDIYGLGVPQDAKTVDLTIPNSN